MTVTLYTNNSERNKVDKDLTQLAALSCYLREECSITDPVLMIQTDSETLTPETIAACNYFAVDEFGRSYFVTAVESVRSDLWAITGHVDVLSSFAVQIRANKGIVRRAEGDNAFNLYINDGSLVAYQDPYILTEPFPNGFTGAGFILAVASG